MCGKRWLVLAAVVELALCRGTAIADIPPLIPEGKYLLHFSPYRFAYDDHRTPGEDIISNIPNIHEPLFVYDVVDSQCTVDNFRELISEGDFSLLYINSHGAIVQTAESPAIIAVEVFEDLTYYNNSTFCKENRITKAAIDANKKLKKYLGAIDNNDPEVFIARYRTLKYGECDNVDNDNDGQTDEAGEENDYFPQYDNDEDGVMELYAPDGIPDLSCLSPVEIEGMLYCGDKNGDGCPGVCGIDDDSDRWPFVYPAEVLDNELMEAGVYDKGPNYPTIAVNERFVTRYGHLNGALTFFAGCDSYYSADSFLAAGGLDCMGYVGYSDPLPDTYNVESWIGGMTGQKEIKILGVALKTNASSLLAYWSGSPGHTGGAVLMQSGIDVRMYNPPRIAALYVKDESGEFIYDYRYSQIRYPFIGGYYPDRQRLDIARQKEADPGDTVNIEIQFTRKMDPGSLSVRIVPEGGPQDKAFDVSGNLQWQEMNDDIWVGTSEIPSFIT